MADKRFCGRYVEGQLLNDSRLLGRCRKYLDEHGWPDGWTYDKKKRKWYHRPMRNSKRGARREIPRYMAIVFLETYFLRTIYDRYECKPLPDMGVNTFLSWVVDNTGEINLEGKSLLKVAFEQVLAFEEPSDV